MGATFSMTETGGGSRRKAHIYGWEIMSGQNRDTMNTEKAQTANPQTYRDKVESLVLWLEDKKAQDIVALDVTAVNSLTEAVLIVSATTVRHAQSLADGLISHFQDKGYEYLGMEGYQVGTWILIDGNDVIIHIFQQEARSFYHLESLWTEAPRLHG